jgi:hypothetical protein
MPLYRRDGLCERHCDFLTDLEERANGESSLVAGHLQKGSTSLAARERRME